MGFANNSKNGLTAVAVFVATAALVWFGWGLNPWWPLMWLAPVPVLWFSLRSSWRVAGLVAFVSWFAGNLVFFTYFHRLGQSSIAWLANFGGLAMLATVGVLLFRALVLRGAVWSGIAALASLWVSVDWLRYWTTPHGTAADLAYTQLKFLPFLQLASITGPWGMSFVLLLVPAAAVAAWHLRNRNPEQAKRVAFVVGGLLLIILGFGQLRLNLTGQQSTVKVGLAVSDAPENDLVASGPDAPRLLQEYAAQAQALAARGAQVVVLPEKIAVVHDGDAATDDAFFQPIANAAGVTIVAGQLHLSPGPNGTLRYNRAQVYSPHVATASYDKEHMLPPFESNLTIGTQRLTLPRNGATWGVAICKDMDFTSMGRAYGSLGAGLLLVPAWDFNMDRTFHGHMEIMRGVESGFSIVRAAKNGYLTVSDDRGRVLAETRSDSALFVTLLADVPVGHEHTLYQVLGDWFAWLAVAIFAGVIARSLLLLRREPGVSSR